jgi:hypothetical protein
MKFAAGFAAGVAVCLAAGWVVYTLWEEEAGREPGT